MSKNFRCSRFSWQSHCFSSSLSMDLSEACWHEIIFQSPFFFLMHFRCWKGWQGSWNLGLKHSCDKISWRVNRGKNIPLAFRVAFSKLVGMEARIFSYRSLVIFPRSIRKACLQLGTGSTVTSSLQNKIEYFT